MDIQFSSSLQAQSDIVFVGFDGKKWFAPMDETLEKQLQKAVDASKFEGKWGSELSFFSGDIGKQVSILGLDKKEKSQADMLYLGGLIAKLGRKKEKIQLVLSDLEVQGQDAMGLVAQGLVIGDWRFLKYKSDSKKEKSHIQKVNIQVKDEKKSQESFIPLKAAAEGMAASRELVSEPGNVLYPESFMLKAKELETLGCEVEILDEKALAAKNMNAFLSVGQGSERASYLVAIRWKGSKDKNIAPIAFVGKGITFDTGGISLKPSAGMEEMIFDMGGAAAAFGAIKAIALRKAKVNVVAVLGLAENMPDGKASRPGDIVTTYGGKTVEIVNTDAEGRLVLADCLTYAQRDEKAKMVIDLATLTGAMLVSLGEERAGLFSHDEELLAALMAAGDETGEKLWPFPLTEEYDDLIKTKHADIKNVGKGRFGGSIAAAKFLEAFIEEGTIWAHIDMAPTAWRKEEKLPLCAGATGYGARLLDKFIQSKED
ncbi:MAG: leucyl aminopeptidase [Alphaproteobacteria bacterium]